MKAIVKKTGKIVEVCYFSDGGRVGLTDGTFMRPSELTIDFLDKEENNLELNDMTKDSRRKEKSTNVIINIEKLSEYIIIASDDVDEEKLKTKIMEILSKAINSVSIDSIKPNQES